ncbi:MAG TPA: response regulator [Thermoanaerobaculia bacterium]|nr:response regulator [Thermoanaerobaculia bacterium]
MATASAVPEFDAIVAEAARAASVPVAFVGYVGEDGEAVQAARGWTVAVIPPACSFASRIASETDLVVVPDTTRDPRFVSHPLVTGPPNIRFYAGVPLFRDGEFIGALSVVDRTPRTLAADQLASLRLLGRQVTREIEVRRQIEELNDRFREFFEQTDDFVMSISAESRLLHSNEAVVNALGYPREELSKEPLTKYVEPEERDEFSSVLADVFESGEPRVLETTFVTSSGRKIIVEGSLRPRVIEGRTVMARVIFRDITERKEFESELGNARDAALEAARLKTQFLTNVSHEIRTPMNGIVGMLDLLLSTQLNQEQRDYSVQAKSSADQLLSIVNNILYVSNVEAGGLGSANVDFDMFRTLERVVEVMKIGALGKDIEVKFVFDEKLPPIFRGNQSKLRQVITNLMDNAMKFTDEGSVTLAVSQQTETETHRLLRFEVRDTGIGIAPEDRLLLFEKFSQVEGGSTRRYQGTGLGLATARHLVETMGGLIDVDSTPGQGSTFWFSIPFPKPAQTRKPIASSDLEFKGKRVLLIDQFPTSRKIVRHYLENTWEMRVDTAENAAAALAALRSAAASDPIRVVIFDAMPDIDGLSFAKEVHADSKITSTSLIHLLQTTNDVNREEMRAAGINAYLARPVGQGELFDAMTVALAHDALPLARTAAQPFDSRPVPAAVPPEKRKTVRVLLCEDNFLNMKLTMSQLHKLGYDADSVPNGKEAIDAIDKKDYKIVLMDCQMPVLDGYQATIEIRRREKERGETQRRIIAMTANALEGDREKCLAAGMDDYLAKPTKGDELETALARYFG